MSLKLVALNKDNWEEAVDLEVTEEHELYVASNVYSIAEAHFCSGLSTYGIYDDETMVGFAMYGIDEDPDFGDDDGFDDLKDCFELRRFMVAANHRGKGYGREALSLIISEATKQGQESMWLGTELGNVKARSLYASLGFVATGRMHEGEEALILPLKGQEVACENIEPILATSPFLLPEGSLERFCGKYWNASSELLRNIYLEDGVLIYYRNEDSKSELYPVSATELCMEDVPTIRLAFSFTGALPVFDFYIGEKLDTHNEGYEYIELPEVSLKALLGDYHDEARNKTFTVALSDGNLELRSGINFISSLKPVSNNRCLVEEWQTFMDFTFTDKDMAKKLCAGTIDATRV